MFNNDEYKGYSLYHWYLDQNEDEPYGIIVTARIRESGKC